MTSYDLCIIGAGPAGASLAIRMARRGVSVLLCERATFPREKLCGEFLSPGALCDLAELGLDGTVRAAGAARIDRVRFAIGRRVPCHAFERA